MEQKRKEDLVNSDDIFKYQLLSRLQSDCEYYLGNGNRNKKQLWAEDEREQIEVMKPDGENIEVTVKRIVDEEGNDMESAPHPKQVLYIDLGHPLEMYDILRRKE